MGSSCKKLSKRPQNQNPYRLNQCNNGQPMNHPLYGQINNAQQPNILSPQHNFQNPDLSAQNMQYGPNLANPPHQND